MERLTLFDLICLSLLHARTRLIKTNCSLSYEIITVRVKFGIISW